MLAVLTADDLVRAGACVEGVHKAMARHKRLPAAMLTEALLALCADDCERRYVCDASAMDGHGDGYDTGHDTGHGTGDGYSHGYGYGYGHGGSYGDGGMR